MALILIISTVINWQLQLAQRVLLALFKRRSFDTCLDEQLKKILAPNIVTPDGGSGTGGDDDSCKDILLPNFCTRTTLL